MASPPSHPVEKVAEESRRTLVELVLPAWFPRVRASSGGFHESFDRRWRRAPHPRWGMDFRGAVAQARLTWSAAALVCGLPGEAVGMDSAMRHGLAWLERSQWDRERGGWITARGPWGWRGNRTKAGPWKAAYHEVRTHLNLSGAPGFGPSLPWGSGDGESD